jgi:hypothetical protein
MEKHLSSVHFAFALRSLSTLPKLAEEILTYLFIRKTLLDQHHHTLS